MIVVNFKNYSTGREGFKLARKIQKYLPKAIICVSSIDLSYLSYNTKLDIFSQHVDPLIEEKSTGFILPKSVKKSGAVGVLLNHSEHKISFREIKKTIKICNKSKLKVIVCVSSTKEASKIKELKPFAIALEIPSLISTGKSITDHNNTEILDLSKLLKGSKIKFLCGSGISTAKDIKRAYDLGCDGVLISSAIAKVNKPELFLRKIKEVRNEN